MEVIMKSRITNIVLIALVLAAVAGADSFESIETNGGPNPTEKAAGVFLPVHEGSRTSGSAFLMQGGLPAELDHEPIADLWLLDGGSWIEIPSSAPRVAGHVLIAAEDGRGYAFGGHDPDDDGDLRELNEITAYRIHREGTALDVDVEEIRVPGNYPGKCTDAAAVAIDGRRSILHIGGFCNWNVMDNGSREVWEYQIDANRWTRRADLPQPRMNHSAVFSRGYVWVFAGEGPGGSANDVFRYDPRADVWSEIQTTGGGPDPLYGHGAAVVGESMLVFGGARSEFWPEATSEVWELDLSSLEWTRKTDLPHDLARMSLDEVPSELSAASKGQVLIFGGVIDPWSFPVLQSDETLVYTSDATQPDKILAVPAIARIRGRGAFFTSTLYLLNIGTEDLEIELTFTPRMDMGGATRSAQSTVPAGVMESISDPLGALFGFEEDEGGVGSLVVEVIDGTADNLLAQSIVTAKSATGEEYGCFFPAIRSSEALAASEVGYLTTTEDPSMYRVNVGLTALVDGTEISVAPTSRIGEKMAAPAFFDLEQGENLQIDDFYRAFGITDAVDALVEIEVMSGNAAAYATILDGNGGYAGTSDPTTVQPVVAESDRVVLLEIGSVQGINEFSGSATIVNLSDRTAEVRANFHERGVPGVASSNVVTIAAGKAIGYRNLVDEVFGLSDAVGSVVLESLNGARINVSGREFANLRDGWTGEIVGTAGTSLPGVTDSDLLTADSSWHVFGLRQMMAGEARERSHLAVFNPGSTAARVRVTLLNGSDGAFEGSREWVVEGEELIHINNVMQKINAAIDGREKRLEIRVEGSVFVQAYRVNTWGDSATLTAKSR
jgi:hypothetical protein